MRDLCKRGSGVLLNWMDDQVEWGIVSSIDNVHLAAMI
ncbi:hypothetical protein PALA111701_24505 [Paenibacillus lactis]